MLIKCPKCGFSQPKDQYCAQCGIDIYAFKPPRQSPLIGLFKDPMFHIGLIVIVSIVSTFVLHRKQKNEIEQRVTYLRGTSFPQKIQPSDDFNEGSTNSAQGFETTTSSTEKIAQEPTSAENTKPAQAADSKTMALDPDSTTLVTASATKAKSLAGFKVKVIYAEMSPRVFDRFIEESSRSNQYNNFGDYSAGIIPNIQKKLTQMGREVNILRTDLDPIELGKSLSWTFNYRSNDREPAATAQAPLYSTLVNLEETENQIFKGNLEIVRSQKENVDSGLARIHKSNFPAAFEITQDSAFFMSGLGAHRPDGPKSENEFVVLVQFEKGQ